MPAVQRVLCGLPDLEPWSTGLTFLRRTVTIRAQRQDSANPRADATNRRARPLLAVQHMRGYVSRTGPGDGGGRFCCAARPRIVGLIVQVTC
jgi:hypothetical protein